VIVVRRWKKRDSKNKRTQVVQTRSQEGGQERTKKRKLGAWLVYGKWWQQ